MERTLVHNSLKCKVNSSWAKKGKMMKPQLTMETNVESFATHKKNKEG
jgi:hypothetical protein